jgi:hypothetical protein
MNHDQENGAQARPGPHFPPPQYPPPTAPPPQPPLQPGPANLYFADPHPPIHHVQAGWPPVSAHRPSPLWGLTVPAAILAFPIGLVAVYFSAQVNQNLRAGDLAAAAKNAGLAKTWGIILLALGVIVTFSYLGTT